MGRAVRSQARLTSPVANGFEVVAVQRERLHVTVRRRTGLPFTEYIV